VERRLLARPLREDRLMELFIFPAAYKPGHGFFVCAMHSQSYGSEWGDPRRNNAVVPGDLIDHDELHEWLRSPDRGLSMVAMLGGEQHGPIRNKPPHLLIQFATDTQREAFAKEFGF